MVVADVHKRFKQLWRKDAVLSTGTDEHGMKVFQALIQLTSQVQKAALAKGEDPLQFCTTAAEKFKVVPMVSALTCRIWQRK
jgi:methionyl-tRNA synthetase